LHSAVVVAIEDVVSQAIWFGVLAVLTSIVPALSARRLAPARALGARLPVHHSHLARLKRQ
jgi:ABC-type antimicrobial peptide transport system permease subunit